MQRKGGALRITKNGNRPTGNIHLRALDRAAVAFSAFGYEYGVVPIDVLLVLCLAWRRRFREGLFAGLRAEWGR